MHRLRLVVVAIVASLGLLAGGPAAASQEATPAGAPGAAPPPAGCTVVASGLLNPRYVAVADDGTLYVSEAGTGGEEPVFPPALPLGTPVVGTPAPVEPIGFRGMTGQVTMVTPDGTPSVVASGLPSYGGFFGPETVGPAGIAVADGTVWLAVGGAGPATAFLDPLPNENAVVQIDPQTGTVTRVADIDAYERANNPDPHAVDSNLYGLGRADDGTLYVADAGGNAVYRVDPAGGEPALLAVIPGLPLPEGMEAPPGGNPLRGGANELDPVPTGVTIGPGGEIYVGLLSGGPFPPGAAKVLQVAEDGTLSDAATGLTMVVDVAVGPDGSLYASQISTNFLGEQPAPGNVVRILPDGTSEVVIDGLMLPNGITFDDAGNLYVVTNTVSFGPPAGQVLRCEGVTGAGATPAASPVATPAAVTIELSDMVYTPSAVTIPADTDVTLRLVNRGFMAHDLVIDALDIGSPVLAPAQEITLTVNLPAGDYTFGCDQPGHRLANMVGTIHAVGA